MNILHNLRHLFGKECSTGCDWIDPPMLGKRSFNVEAVYGTNELGSTDYSADYPTAFLHDMFKTCRPIDWSSSGLAIIELGLTEEEKLELEEGWRSYQK